MNLLYWLVPWEPSLVVIVASGAAALLFLRGSARSPVSGFRKTFFWLGLVSLYAVSQTQFDYYAEHAFFVHRLQHLVLHHLGPFLIALGRPGAALAAGVPEKWRRSWPNALLRLAAFLNHPVVAVLLFSGLILFWLVPHIHLIAMLDWRLYRVMNWGMAANGLMFWSVALSNTRPAAPRILMMLAVIPAQIAMGALLFLEPRDLYPVYSLCGRAFAGLMPLADQQTGGLILWVGGAMMSVAGILIAVRGKVISPYPQVSSAAQTA